ncbi:unnamed protein product, partial [Rotaria magnacalcarata]
MNYNVERFCHAQQHPQDLCYYMRIDSIFENSSVSPSTE